MELEFGVLHKTTLPFILWKKHTEHCGDLKYKISTNLMWITFISDQFLIFSNSQNKENISNIDK